MSVSTIPEVAAAADAPPAQRARRFGSWHGKKRLRVWLVRALLALAGVALLYIIVGNIFVRTRLLRNLIGSDPGALLVDYESAWTFVPGRAHVENLSIRGRDSAVEWILKIDDVDFSVSFTDLMRRRFHATRVRGSGVTFLLRRRIPTADITPMKLHAMPPIPGFDWPPAADPVKAPPLTDADYNLFRVELSDVIADPVREVWIDEAQFVGDARITGGFFLQPLRWVTVGPANVQFRSGDARTGSDLVLRDLHGTLDCTIHGFDPRLVGGSEVLDYLSAGVSLDGTVPDLAFVRDFADASASGGAGPAHVDIAVDGGLLTRLDVDVVSEAARVALGKHAVHASARTRARTTERGIEVDVATAPLALWRTDERAALVHAPKASAILRTEDRALAHLFSKPWLAFDVPEADIPDLRRFDAYLAKDGDLHLEAGRGTLRVQADLGPSTGHGEATLHIAEGALRVKQTRVRGDVTVDAKMPHASLAASEVDLAGTRIEIANARALEADGAPWSATARLSRARGRFGETTDFNAHVDATCIDARPLFNTLIADTPIPKWAIDLLAIHGVTVSSDVSVSPPSFAVRNLRAKVEGRFEVAADVMDRRGVKHSAMLVTSGPLSLGVETKGDDTHLVPLAGRDWFGKVESTFR